MKRIEITYEVTRRTCETFLVTDEEYDLVKSGEIPERITMELENNIDTGYGDREDNWAAVDDETGEVLQEWA